jgi:enoyl-[acyl-carrier protein] reductase II
MKSPLCELFKIQYPIIQGGMVWVSGANLATAVSNAGGLGLIGAGSMNLELLKDQLIKANSKTSRPYGINIPLLYSKANEQIDLALELGVKIFFTSAGNPKTYTKYLKDNKAIVVHVTSSPQQAKKCEDQGVDAIVAEGFEAGGHNGILELTTMSLIPMVKKEVSIPIIAAGGIGNGAGMLAAFSLGACGVQMGTRFLMSKESSAHENFKNYILNTENLSTKLLMKSTIPVRLLDNKFKREIEEIENNLKGIELKEALAKHLGHGRAKQGMLEGNLEDGELEIGQIIGLLKDLPSSQEIITNLIFEFNEAKNHLFQL